MWVWSGGGGTDGLKFDRLPEDKPGSSERMTLIDMQQEWSANELKLSSLLRLDVRLVKTTLFL